MFYKDYLNGLHSLNTALFVRASFILQCVCLIKEVLFWKKYYIQLKVCNEELSCSKSAEYFGSNAALA